MPSLILELSCALLRWQTLDFMLQTKTETNTMVYGIKKLIRLKSIFYIRKYVVFIVFVVLGWMSKTCF